MQYLQSDTKSSNVNMISTQPLFTTSNLYHASGCNYNIARPLACFTFSQHQPLYTTSSIHHASKCNDVNVPPLACFTSSQHQPLYTTSSLYRASGCNDGTVPPLTCFRYSTPILRSTYVTSANPLCITGNIPTISSINTQNQDPL